MNQRAVLDDLKAKQSISFIEAERGLLAALLQAVRDQVEADREPITDAFGPELDWGRIDSTLTAEFKDMIRKHRNDDGSLDRDVLDSAAAAIEDRVGMDGWDDGVREEYEQRSATIIDKCSRKQVQEGLF